MPPALTYWQGALVGIAPIDNMHQWCHTHIKHTGGRMARRSIALTPNLERLVHMWQAQSIQALNKDVSFNGALNQMLAWGVVAFTTVDAKKVKREQIRKVNVLLQHLDLENRPIGKDEFQWYDTCNKIRDQLSVVLEAKSSLSGFRLHPKKSRKRKQTP
jgi:hypothetical protein